MSQLTLVALVLLVAFLWKFGPWNRINRILSYDFPSGWWNHIKLITELAEHWPAYEKKQLERFIQVFVDQVEFHLDPSLEEEFEIKHRVAIATQFYLVIQNIKPNPFKTLERVFLQRSMHEQFQTQGLLTLFWDNKDENFKQIVNATGLSTSLSTEDKEQICDYLTKKMTSDPEVEQRLRNVFG